MRRNSLFIWSVCNECCTHTERHSYSSPSHVQYIRTHNAHRTSYECTLIFASTNACVLHSCIATYMHSPCSECEPHMHSCVCVQLVQYMNLKGTTRLMQLLVFHIFPNLFVQSNSMPVVYVSAHTHANVVGAVWQHEYGRIKGRAKISVCDCCKM